MNSRRDALKALAVASAATAASQAQHSHEPGALTKITAPTVRFFSAEEFRALTKLVDLIIPRTETPGASDAGVHYLIDETVARRAALQKEWRAGLRLLMPRADSEWTPLLTKWSREKDTSGARFFQLAKGAVVDFYYSTREGLTSELEWHGNTFLAKFDGCTHPEHKS